MDSRRFLLAVILMIAVMIVTNLLLPPPPPMDADAAADSLTTDSPATADRPAPPASAPDTRGGATGQLVAGAPVDSGAPADSGARQLTGADPSAGVTALPDDTLVVRSDLYAYEISTRSAAFLDARLLGFNVLQEGREEEPVRLAPPDLPGLFSYRLRVGTREIPFSSLGFIAEPEDTLAVDSAAASAVTLTHAGSGGVGVEVRYEFDPGNYTIDVRMVVTGTGDQTPTLFIALPRSLAMNEGNNTDDERALAYVVNNEQEGINSERLESIDEEIVENGPLHWAAIKNKYFVAAALKHPQTQTPFGG
ncbi:MAG TPA: membrane protein insertase YidC, partial [Longimicrobiales bacterium]|nr:membrane protein insertase YidC [Longimicrobiales bacterium]